jgi:hypothetical protein
MKHPIATLNPQQRMVADLLAIGVRPEQAATIAGLPVSHVKVWLKGSLFTLEVDRARERVMKKRRDAFMGKVADELEANLESLRKIRDSGEKDSDRLRAIELMVAYGAVPLSKRTTDEGRAEVHVVIEGEKARQMETVLAEVVDAD